MAPKTTTAPNARHLTEILASRIADRTYPDGQWLPPERDLAEEFQVHRRVVREAIERLAGDGMLICRPRCRPVVAATAKLTAANPAAAQASTPAASGAGARLVALIMWHGGLPMRTSAQQRIFWGFNRVLSEAGYHGVFLDIGESIETEEENAVREAARLQYARDHHFAGIVFYPYAYRSNRELIRETARHIPLVLLDRHVPGIETDYVGIDNMAAMREATEHLLALGHRRIALVTRSEPINTVQDRIAAYRVTMRRADPPADDMVLTVDSSLEWGFFDHLFRLPAAERPSALLCVNDSLAWSAAERLEALGLRVPEDVALVGFDDLVQTLPNGVGLSSVAQPFEEIGVSAAYLLLNRLSAPALPVRQLELGTTLNVRASSNPLSPDNFGPTSGLKKVLDTIP